MSTTKIVVTRALIRQVLGLAEYRYVAKGKKDKNASLTTCRDLYWKKFPHFYQRVGKAFAVYGAEDTSITDWGTWLSNLTDAQLAQYLTKLRHYYNDKKKAQAEKQEAIPGVVPVVQGTVVAPDEDTFDSGGGFVVDAQTQEDLEVPTGFADLNDPPPDFGYLGVARDVDTSGQNQLAVRVREALLSQTRCKTAFHKDDGELTQNRFSDIAQGTNLSGLYHQRTQGKALRVACQIYIDLSGSMRGEVKNKDTGVVYMENGAKVSRFTLVERLCYALGLTLEQLHVPYQVIGFSQASVLLKNFNGRISNSPLNQFYIDHDASTYLGSSLELGLPMLAKRHEPRKLAFILTDGDVGKVENVLPNFPQIETCAFGVAEMIRLDAPFTYRMCPLYGDLVEVVASKVASVIAQKPFIAHV